MFLIARLLVLIFLFCGCDKTSTKDDNTLSTKAGSPPQDANFIDNLKYQIKNNKLPNITNFKPLTYCEFMLLRKERKISDEQAEQLIDYAYSNDNPILFRVSNEKISPDSYSLNFLWISSKKLSEEGHILGTNEEQLQKNIINPLLDWQSKQPEANINFWYDEDMLQASSITNTKQVFKDNKLDLNKITFRNIREMPLVRDNLALFDEKIDVFFRVDLSKALIGLYVLTHDKIPFAINIDSDIVAITREQLFDQKTLDGLRDLGYILGVSHTLYEENSFIMLFAKAKVDLIKAYGDIVINESIADAHELLKQGRAIEKQIVFRKYDKLYITLKKAYQAITNKTLDRVVIRKDLIFPPSALGGGGYTDEQIKILQKALVGPEGCP